MRRYRTSGFSLIELLVTIAIVAILVALAFPSFQGSLRSNRVTSATNELIASISLARTEGMRNPRGAVICTSADGTSCGGTWNDGWIVWIDVNGNGNLDAPNDRILRYVRANNRLTFTATSPGGAAFANTIVFNNRGRADPHSRTLTLQPDDCPSGQQLHRQLELARTGQVRTTKGTCT